MSKNLLHKIFAVLILISQTWKCNHGENRVVAQDVWLHIYRSLTKEHPLPTFGPISCMGTKFVRTSVHTEERALGG